MVSLLQPLVSIAVAEAGDQYGRMVNFKTELRSLERIVSIIEGALPEAEEKQVDNPTIRVWLRDLDDICYDARDILDEFVTVAASIRARRSNSMVISNPLRASNRFCTVILFRLALRFRLVNKIKKLRKRLHSMKEDMEIKKVLVFVGGAERSPNAPNRPQAGSSPDKRKLVGREVEKKKIMEKLQKPEENRVEVVPIWGMGGVGKTTLAQSVFNDEGVTEEQYPTKNRRWLFVGEKKFNAKEIISTIIGESVDTNDVEAYQRKLTDKFREDRFFIVLDDVWDVNNNEWKLFCNPLNKSRKGGMIIITTRTQDVITAIKAPVPYDLKPLSNEDCWQIFESCAFHNRDTCNDVEQKKDIGKQIVEKLKGLPLAADVVGHSLSMQPNVQTWRSFLEARKWRLPTGDDYDVMSALRWSYNHLPPHLKQCFTYSSLFPKDHVFDEKILVEMWMAHGYIQNVEVGGEEIRLEDIGANYFKQLVNASLFYCVDGRYVMHDMIHDLATLVSKEEFLRTDGLQLDGGKLEKVRHISAYCRCFWENVSLCISNRSTLKRLLTLHTLDAWNSSYIPETFFAHRHLIVIQDIFKQLKSIRVLVLHSFKMTSIPKCISKLIHLRYLDIEQTSVKRIPYTFCDLHNLQTLVAPRHKNSVITVLPKNIGNMTNLRHLRARLSTCKGVKNLISLQELHSISVSKGDNISELGDMRQLRGKFKVKCLENVTSEEDAAQAMMQEKTNIDELKLEFTKGLGDIVVQEKVLDALQCPPNLRVLKIYGYKGRKPPSWMVDGKLIKNLQSLHLLDCHHLVCVPPLGQLNSLKRLWFHKMSEIQKLDLVFYGEHINTEMFFPSLEELDLRFMENLKEWDDIVIDDTSVMFFTCLKTLEIVKCPNLVSALPHVKICTPHMNIKDPSRNVANVMRSLSTLKIRSCDKLVVLKLNILVSLKHLEINDCPNLTYITSAVNVAATVEILFIKRCRKLEKMEFGSLSALKNLTINDCNELISFPRIVAIEELAVCECEKLRSLRINDRGLNSLQRLKVLKCPMLEILFEDSSTSSASSSSSALRLSRLRVLTTDNTLVTLKMFEHDLISLEEMRIPRDCGNIPLRHRKCQNFGFL